MGSLKNSILIAMPHLRDPYFAKSVVLICDHTKEGAMGLIVNRPFEEPELKKLFVDVYEENTELLEVVHKLYFGGPVMIERGIILHSGEYQSEHSIRVSDLFAISSHKDILEAISKNKGPEKFKLVLGHAGWVGGQLEREIENGDWLLQTASPDYVFSQSEKLVWQQAARSFGIEVSDLMGIGGQA
ncbi:MAG: YqgE/AlgH family protein [FCB group bacterium]|nr:YqgE/AlgH family protein [FCB group bacterium]